jgi:hypothetical protein
LLRREERRVLVLVVAAARAALAIENDSERRGTIRPVHRAYIIPVRQTIKSCFCSPMLATAQ